MEILRVEDLVKTYGKGENQVNAVDHISFSIEKGEFMRVILIILKLIGRILLIPVWLILAFIGVCVSAVVNLYCVAKGLAGLLLGAMLVCTFIWYRTRFMNYILLGVAEFMLVGVLAAGAFILALVTEARDGVGRFIIGG